MTTRPGGGPPAGRSSDLSRLARGGAITLFGVVGNGVLQFVLAVVVGRAFHAHGAGIFFQAVALFMILTKLASFGADTGLIRTIPRFRALGRIVDVRRTLAVALGPVLVAGTALGVAVFVLTPLFVKVFLHKAADPEALSSIRLLAPFLPLGALATVILQGTRGFGTTMPFVAVENLGKPALRLLLVVLAVVAGLGVAPAVVLWAVPSAVGVVIALVLLARLVRRAEQRAGVPAGAPRPIRELATEFWAFSFARGVAEVLQVSILWFGVLLVGALRSPAEAGVYAAASRYVVAGAFALQAVRLAVSPQFSGLLARGDLERAQRLYQVSTWWAVAVSSPVYLTLAAFAPFFLGLFGAEFISGEATLVILCLAMLVNIGVGNASVIILMSGKSTWNLLNSAGALLAFIVLNLLLTPRYGIDGAAIAWAAAIVLNRVAPLLQLHFWLGLRPFGSGYLLVALGAVGCYGLLGLAARMVFGAGPLVVTASAVLATGLYLGLLLRYRELLQLSALREAFRSRRRADSLASSG